ncbi:MAG: retropepsin-like aspartic protease [Bacteroidetes bacterium]|nr:retropepsin-like aspartic protease [Bacteroidota bacterium]
MPSFVLDIKNNQAFLESTVGRPESPDETMGFKALLDTGAQRTLVSPKIVKDLGLIPIAPASVRAVSGGVVDTKEYRMNVSIPIQLGNNAVFDKGSSMNVLLLPYQPKDYDVLLGMDFLSGFHITLFGKQMIISN